MKSYEFSFTTILLALRHHWRAYLLIVLLFIALGLASGLIWAGQLAAPAEGQADPIAPADLSTVPAGINQYYTCFVRLQTTQNNLRTYLDAMASEQTLTEGQRAQLAELNDSFAAYTQERFLPLQAFFSNYSVKDFFSHHSAMVGSADKRSAPLPGASRNNFVNRRVRHAEDLIHAAEEGQAAQLAAINTAVDTIAVSNHLNVHVTYNEAFQAVVVPYHTHRAVSARENFQILTIYCTLAGICVGAYFCVCQEAGSVE